MKPANPIVNVATEYTPSFTGAHQSRWGFHPCNYQGFYEVREYFRLLLRAYCTNKHHHAWARKTKYRTGPEPARVPHFFARPGSFDCHKFGALPDEQVLLEAHRAYRAARTPAPSEGLVVPLQLRPDWRRAAMQLRLAFLEIDRAAPAA